MLLICLALDVDGTIANGRGVISPFVASALRQAQEFVAIALVSGRPLDGIRFVQRCIGISGPEIGLNGAVFRMGNSTVEVLGDTLSNSLQEAALQRALNMTYPAACFTYDVDRWFAWGKPEAIEEESTLTGMHPICFPEGEPTAVSGALKLTFVYDSESAADKGHVELFAGALSANVSRSRPRYLELTDRTATKGAALTHLRSVLSCTSVIAVGDGLNDIEMFRAADWSYAMPSACEEVLMAASAVLREPADQALVRIIRDAAVGLFPTEMS